MAKRTRAWLISAAVFAGCLLPAFFLAITLIGHARPLPYMSAWLDKLVLVAVSLGLPALAAIVVFRLLAARRP